MLGRGVNGLCGISGLSSEVAVAVIIVSYDLLEGRISMWWGILSRSSGTVLNPEMVTSCEAQVSLLIITVGERHTECKAEDAE